MTSYRGGTRVKSGYYIDARTFAFANVAKDGGALPGAADARYVRLPLPLVVAAAPVLGGLFVVALPFIGIGVTVYAVGRALGGRAKAGAEEIAATVAPGWAPGEAHLTGKKAEGEPVKDARIEALEKEIGEKREGGKS